MIMNSRGETEKTNNQEKLSKKAKYIRKPYATGPVDGLLV